MFFLFFILVLIGIFCIFILATSIEIKIQNFRFSTDKIMQKENVINYSIYLNIYFFRRLKIKSINLTKTKLEKEKIELNFKKMDEKIKQNKINLKTWYWIKYLRIKARNLNISVYVGTEDAGITAILTGIISTVFGIVLKNIVKEDTKNYWSIEPLYLNRNLLNIELDGIFSLKLIHIIYTIIYLCKMKGEKNVRTSNRRPYAYSNE